MPNERTRFAPSPTGWLHLGHALAAITAREAAGSGTFLLRIEDLDRQRSRPQFEAGIEEDLRWLGLVWESPVLRQSARSAAYADALRGLASRSLTYPCFCSRREIAEEIARAAEAPHAAAAVYPGTCRTLSLEQRRERIARGEPYAVRLDIGMAVSVVPPLSFVESGHGPHGERGEIAVRPDRFGDVVPARKDLPAAYHLAVVVDDAFQGVSLVTRGQDLFEATDVQRLLQALLDLPVPRYAHHRLIRDPSGKRFSKRDEATTLRSLRAAGVEPAAVRERIGL